MGKAIVFLADGMADEPLPELGGKTPVEAASTPRMDWIAKTGASGTFLTLPEGFPTSSDVANMSVMGYDLAVSYPGRGPLEAASQNIALGPDDSAWRCNLVHIKDGKMEDYSAGHIANAVSSVLMADLQSVFGSDKVSFHAGVSYRNLFVLHGGEFSEKVYYHKPDSSHGEKVSDLALSPLDSSPEAAFTVAFLNELMAKTSAFLLAHPLCKGLENPPNSIWPWSPGRKPNMKTFAEKYAGAKAAVITAVDVIAGIAKCAKMDVIPVPGATGFIDTNYKGKADAAIEAIKTRDFVFLHVEAPDECSHIGDLKLKMRAIEDFDSKIMAPVIDACKGMGVTFAVLPDHPAPVRLRKHTRTPVPVSVCGPHIKPDGVEFYSEKLALGGALGHMSGDALMRLVLNIK
jgi:2,3-bisphosphoglycerate-independent phosphoglycerate mutase